MCGTECASAMKKRGCGLDRSYRGEEKGETDLDSVQFLDLVRLVDLVQSGLDVDACIQYATRPGLQLCIRGIENHPCRRTYYSVHTGEVLCIRICKSNLR